MKKIWSSHTYFRLCRTNIWFFLKWPQMPYASLVLASLNFLSFSANHFLLLFSILISYYRSSLRKIWLATSLKYLLDFFWLKKDLGYLFWVKNLIHCARMPRWRMVIGTLWSMWRMTSRTPWVDGHVWSESFPSWKPIKALLTPSARDPLRSLPPPRLPGSRLCGQTFLSHPKIWKNGHHGQKPPCPLYFTMHNVAKSCILELHLP